MFRVLAVLFAAVLMTQASLLLEKREIDLTNNNNNNNNELEEEPFSTKDLEMLSDDELQALQNSLVSWIEDNLGSTTEMACGMCFRMKRHLGRKCLMLPIMERMNMLEDYECEF